jgi:outer membrane receptor protein involved in Fe transport
MQTPQRLSVPRVTCVIQPAILVGLLFISFSLLILNPFAFAQTSSATLSGTVLDPSGAVVPDAQVLVTNADTNVSVATKTNGSGVYVVEGLIPGRYRMVITKMGFKQITIMDVTLHIQDTVSRNFNLEVGATSETVNVSAEGELNINTTDGSVSTVVDQQFVANMPLNGRSFQSLISMTPGVVFAAGSATQTGQFSVNGQRTASNYFMVDGVSANVGAGTSSTMGPTLSGSTPGWTIAGGTNGLVSVDAMQEFRIQTSTFAPEFGRSPGGQISVATKSGSNAFHGNAFDYLRNDVLDARNYFNKVPAAKPPLRQNDFGGTFGGPIIKDKTFFFFSYEGIRLRQPQTYTGSFYTAAARAKMASVWKPFVNADPIPDGPVNANGFSAPLTMSVSLPSTLNATSIRVDHNLTKRIILFARYNYAPSNAVGGFQNESRTMNTANVETATAGAIFTLSTNKTNDFRANWSYAAGGDKQYAENFYGGVMPPESSLYPAGFTMQDTQLYTSTTGTGNAFGPRLGPFSDNHQRQLNFVDTFSWTTGKHQLKFGFDLRRMKPTPSFAPQSIGITASYADLQAGTVTVNMSTGGANTVILRNYSSFAQDTFKASSRLTLTYGIRWDVNQAPISATNKPIYAVQGVFDSQPLAVAPAGTPIWHTKLANFSPRVGTAYQVTPKTVVRGGFGIFYDMGVPFMLSSQLAINFPWYRSVVSASSIPFNLSNPAIFQLPPFSLSTAGVSSVTVGAFDPNLKLPRVYEWNVAFERELGRGQSVTVSYVAAKGQDLIRQDGIRPVVTPPWSISAVYNGDWSYYDSLQVEFQRHMSHGLQAMVSYTWSKSTDTASNDNTNISTVKLSDINIGVNEGYSDFDVRHNFSGAVSYELPSLGSGRLSQALTKGWALDGIVRMRSGLPINILNYTNVLFNGVAQRIRPDAVAGQPFWIEDGNAPGGKRLNTAAFIANASNVPGNLTRNLLRNFGMNQTDLALRRRFALTERVKMDLRVEYFNIFNHPMLALGSSDILLNYGNFGKASQTLNTFLGGGTSQSQGGAVASQYGMGGPRSGQLTLKVSF